MTLLEYEDLDFKEEKEHVKFIFYKQYTFFVKKDDLPPFKLHKNAIEFDLPDKTANNKMNKILQKGFNGLSSPNKRPTTYIHSNSGIPLIGSNVFGIIDRDTNTIEIKPMTGCNLNCVFCSVDEGPRSKKVRDFLVEKEYLVQEFVKVAQGKKGKVEAHIAGQNEPTMYPKVIDLIRDIKATGLVKEISIDTNGSLLTKAFVDELIGAGLDRFDLSLNSLDEKKADELAGGHFPLAKVIEMAEHINKKATLLLAPVLVPGKNEEDIEEIIKFGKRLGCHIGIQNFLGYEKGRRAGKSITMDDFEKRLCTWEKKFDVDLHLKGVFSFAVDKSLMRPMRKDEIVQAELVGPGKFRGEWILQANDRLITVQSKELRQKNHRVKIIREKHNIYKGTLCK